MDNDGVVTMGLETMKSGGAQKAQAQLVLSERSELNVETGRISLLRTTVDAALTLAAISEDGRRGSITVNRVDADSVAAAAAQAVAIAASAPPDPANDIAPAQEPAVFGVGPEEPDRDAMYRLLSDFLLQARQRFPRTLLEVSVVEFTRSHTVFANTNGVRFQADKGIYGFVVVFTTKDGRRTTSMNYCETHRRDLEGPLSTWGNTDELMRQSSEQLDQGPVEGKFLGDIIMTPDCLAEMLGIMDRSLLGDEALITGRSPIKDSLGKPVASPLFTLRSCPVSPEMQDGYFFTPDGQRAEDCALITGGVLKGFNLSLYGSRKTGKSRAPNAGGCWIVDPGERGLSEMIGSVKRGLLLCRLSEAGPSDNGDFSGVAKNSYLIEEGRLGRPVNETMVSGNLAKLLCSVSAVSRERIDFGTAVLPWVSAGGVTISGR